ncbi:hypothetical protein K3495_g11731 [Podosphaera aphanis]|nr:hypothetical protein K3495_g11731 [Podosphaera aphanis]
MSAQSIFLEAIEVARVWKVRTRLPHTLAGNINIRWVPSHAGIEGSELADLEAKKGASLPSPENQEYSFATLEKWQSTFKRQETDDWWRNHSPPSHQKIEINDAPSFPKEPLLSRRHLGRVIAARTGHGDHATYHTRFKHTEATL